MSANDVIEHFAFPRNIDFSADDQGAFWCVYSSSVNQSLPSVNHEQFPMQMTHKHNKWLHRAPNPRPGRFSTETPLERERRLQIQREQRTETSTRNRGAEGTSLGTAKATPTTRDRGTGDWNQRHYDRSLSKTHSPPIYVDQSLQSFSSVLYVPNNNRLI